MKKILILLLSIFILASCGKTKFEDLPENKQEEIQSKIQEDVIAPYISDLFGLAFSNMGKTDEEMEGIMNDVEMKFENDLKIYLESNYPEIEFDFSEISKIDNSREDEVIEEEKSYEIVEYGNFYTFESDSDSDKKINLKVNDIVWKGNTYESYFGDVKANNEFLFIRLEAENIGKKSNFIHLGDVKLITRDGYEFDNEDTQQNPDNLKEGYNGCISCSMNPMEKGEQYLIFDIKKIDLAGAKLRFEDELVEFEI